MQVFCNAEGKHLRARLSCTAGHTHADGVIAADKQRRFGRRCQCTRDRILHTVDLPFAIELVAEEVQKDHELWPELRHDVHGAELICLDDAPVGARSRQKCSHDAWRHVRASTVAEHTLSSRLDSGGDDVVRGRLAVRAADDDGALLQLLGEARDDIGIDGQGNASRQLRSVAPEHRAETPAGEVPQSHADFRSDVHGPNLSSMQQRTRGSRQDVRWQQGCQRFPSDATYGPSRAQKLYLLQRRCLFRLLSD
jgi:hypothetical protein